MKSPNSIVKPILGAFVIFVAAFGGMYFGGLIGKNTNNVSAEQDDVFTDLKLIPGVSFPDIELINGEYKSVMSKALLHPRGTVVLFMDDDCPPCGDVARDWQKKIDDGVIDSNQVMGICFANAAQIHSIHEKYHVKFPIYGDERYVFLDNYGVDAFPLILVLDRAGIVRHKEYDSNQKIEPSELKKLLQG